MVMPSIKKPERQRTKTFIYAWRKFRHLTQEQMAGRVGMSRENYGRVESGKVPYNQDFLEAAALALNCSTSDLLERDPFIENYVDELRSLLKGAPEAEQRQILAIARTFFQNKG